MITTTFDRWLDIIARANIKHHVLLDKTRIYMILDRNLMSGGDQIRVVLNFDGSDQHVFTGMYYEPMTSIEEIPEHCEDTMLSDWVSLLKSSQIYHTLREFKTRRWTHRWLEFPCYDVNHNNPLAIEVAYYLKINKDDNWKRNYIVFHVDSGAFNGEYNV